MFFLTKFKLNSRKPNLWQHSFEMCVSVNKLPNYIFASKAAIKVVHVGYQLLSLPGAPTISLATCSYLEQKAIFLNIFARTQNTSRVFEPISALPSTSIALHSILQLFYEIAPKLVKTCYKLTINKQDMMSNWQKQERGFRNYNYTKATSFFKLTKPSLGLGVANAFFITPLTNHQDVFTSAEDTLALSKLIAQHFFQLKLDCTL